MGRVAHGPQKNCGPNIAASIDLSQNFAQTRMRRYAVGQPKSWHIHGRRPFMYAHYCACLHTLQHRAQLVTRKHTFSIWAKRRGHDVKYVLVRYGARASQCNNYCGAAYNYEAITANLFMHAVRSYLILINLCSSLAIIAPVALK